MTTEELVTQLKGLGVSDEQADSFRDLRLKGPSEDSEGGTFNVPAFNADGVFFLVHARFTGEDKGHVPEWNSVSTAGETV